MAQVTMEHQLDMQQALESRVLLVAPSLSLFKGYFQIPKTGVAITIDDNVIDQTSLTTNRAILFHKEWPTDRRGEPWKKIFANIESREKALIARFSLPFSIRGVRLIPKARAGELFDGLFGLTVGSLRRRIKAAKDANEAQTQISLERILDNTLNSNPYAENTLPIYDNHLAADEQSIAYSLHLAAEEFCADLAGIYEQISRRLDPVVWLAVNGKLPRDARAMRKKFHLDITPVELAGNAANSIVADDLNEHQAVVRETVQRRVQDAIDSMVRGPRGELAEALANLQQLVSDDGRVTSRSFVPVRAAIEKIRLFEFCADSVLLAQIKTIEQRLDSTVPGDLNSTAAAQNGFSAALTSVMNEVSSEASYARGIEEFGSSAARSIDLD